MKLRCKIFGHDTQSESMTWRDVRTGQIAIFIIAKCERCKDFSFKVEYVDYPKFKAGEGTQ